jgi:hypothetical protein
VAPRPEFDFEALDGRRVSAAAARGRFSVLSFIVTYDMASQAQAGFLKTIAREHVPRANVFAVVLERAESRRLAETFVEALAIRYPVALVPPPRLAGGAFEKVRAVPHTVVLDRDGRLVWSRAGLVEVPELRGVLRRLESGGSP